MLPPFPTHNLPAAIVPGELELAVLVLDEMAHLAGFRVGPDGVEKFRAVSVEQTAVVAIVNAENHGFTSVPTFALWCTKNPP
jgi:hypothetical protein